MQQNVTADPPPEYPGLFDRESLVALLEIAEEMQAITARMDCLAH